jgi:hypothetical protein
MKLTDITDILYQTVMWVILVIATIFGLALTGFVFKFFYNVFMFGWSFL